MEWRGRRESSNVEDAGGSSGGGMRGLGFKGGIGTLILALILWKFFGINPATTMGIGQQMAGSAPPQVQQDSAQTAKDKAFIKVVLADTEDTWGQLFQAQGSQYTPPTLVFFSGSVASACGNASAATGPFYCPADSKVYLDTAFFSDMHRELGVESEQNNSGEAAQNEAGDFAQAYVVAHEVGHHVQHLLGITDQVTQARQRMGDVQANQLSVRQELQADCFAGVWANHNEQRVHFLQQGDIEEALDTAAKIGDDRIQQRSQGYVVPESFTHGTGKQRIYWFGTGLKTGKIEACDTFASNL